MLAAASLSFAAPLSAKEPPATASLKHSPWLALRFEQDGAEVPLTALDTLRSRARLEKRPFTIVLPVRGPDDVYRITAWSDDSIFAHAEQAKRAVVRDRGKYDPPPYFMPYTAMADTAAGSGTLMLNPQGHHYLSGLRLGPDYYRHVFHVGSVLAEDENGNSRELALDEIDGPLYLVAWFDEDGHDKMSHGEYEFLELDFH